MRHFRRVTVEIERKTATLSLRNGASASQTSAPVLRADGPDSPCTVCGSAWMLLHDADRGEQTEFRKLLEGIGLHTHISAAGHLWICQESFQHLQFHKTKEKP